MLALLMSLTVGIGTASAQPAGTVLIQLAIVLDGSGSISSGNWTIMKTGLTDAINNNIPQNGIVKLPSSSLLVTSAAARIPMWRPP
jgi:hypothetical protein